MESDASQSSVTGSDPSWSRILGLDPSQSSVGGTGPSQSSLGGQTSWSSVVGSDPSQSSVMGGSRTPHSPMQWDHLGTGSGPFLRAFPLEALGKSRCAGTGDSGFGSAGGISQQRLKCQGVRTGFWQRSVL